MGGNCPLGGLDLNRPAEGYEDMQEQVTWHDHQAMKHVVLVVETILLLVILTTSQFHLLTWLLGRGEHYQVNNLPWMMKCNLHTSARMLP